MLGRWLGGWLGRWLGHAFASPRPAHPQEAVFVEISQREALQIRREIPVELLLTADVEALRLTAPPVELCVFVRGADEEVATPTLSEPLQTRRQAVESAASEVLPPEEVVVGEAPELLTQPPTLSEPLTVLGGDEQVVVGDAPEDVVMPSTPLHEVSISV